MSASCVACSFPATQQHPQLGSVHSECTEYAILHTDVLLALVAGSLAGCGVCRSSTIWRHPQHGPLHRSCVGRLTEESPEECAASARGRRGAYDRRR